MNLSAIGSIMSKLNGNLMVESLVMKRIYKIVLLCFLVLLTNACSDGVLETQPEEILTDEQVWSNPDRITNALADYYDRLPKHADLDGPGGNCDYDDPDVYCGWFDKAVYDDAMWSGVSNFDYEFRNSLQNYPFQRWSLWNYDLIRDINLSIENIEEADSPSLTEDHKNQFIAELRFIRSMNYFELVKRMGGVPIITETLVYDFSGDPSNLQMPRNTEAEVYDFISSELDAIMDDLGNDGSQTRANRYTALALKSRAMLYAGSIARYNNQMSNPITLENEEGGRIVGIPASRAEDYYSQSLEASRELINNSPYSLYQNTSDPKENFYEAVTSKNNNNEVIFAVDYSTSQGLAHTFTLENIPRGLRTTVEGVSGGSALSPSLNLVEAFDYLNGSEGVLEGVGDGTEAGQSDWVFYNTPEEIFEDKDPRLWGTIIYPGTTFAGSSVEIQAGVYEWNDSENSYERVVGSPNSQHEDGGVLTGASGPLLNENYVSSTGFYIRKYLDTSPGARTPETGSDVWWVWFRLGEIYLNGSEAAYELGETGEALTYINDLRNRAGFDPNSLNSLSIEDIRNERRVELAFEDHRLWDLRRWRIAHEVWDGTEQNPNANIYSLFGYRIHRPGHPDHNKYVYDKFQSPRMIEPRYFRMGNYYSEIPNDVIGNNPELVRNPFH